MKFIDCVQINENFRKSTNLLLDQGDEGFLNDYILSPSNQDNLKLIINATKKNQSAFTFTGPYGSGKSSFALFLSELLAPSSAANYKICIDKIKDRHIKNTDFIDKAKKRTLISIVASPSSPIDLLAEALKCKITSKDILDTISKLMSQNDGLVLIIDELGKILEKTVKNQLLDIYILQQIAELANNSNGKLLFIGILHQSFIEYTDELNKLAQDEWQKIHGRFRDITIDTSNEEKLDLIGRTIISKYKPDKTSKLVETVVVTIAKNRPIQKENYKFLIEQCWPLSPIVALLLGPLSLKNFGQNQRSIFSFLCSEEPHGFHNYLSETKYIENSTYSINNFWKYIKSNFDFILSRSSDSRKWLLAQEVLDRLYAQATVSKIDINIASDILKLIGLLAIFKGNTGLVASRELIHSLLDHIAPIVIDEVISSLQSLSLLREAYDKSGFVLFDGSDFDIDRALEDANNQITDIDYTRLNNIASFQPIVAKRNYHETGTIRWMNISISPFKAWKEAPELFSEKFNNSMFGAWVILIPNNVNEYEEAQKILKNRIDYNIKKPIILGVTGRYKEINNYAHELLALEWIEKHTPSLLGDRFARLEIGNRKNHLILNINKIINESKHEVEWVASSTEPNYIRGQLNTVALNQICSDLAEQTFYHAPVLKTEMLNNNKPSGNANSAVNTLLRKMVQHYGEERLGIPDDKYPAEWGLFNILLEKTGIYHYQKERNCFIFDEPKNDEQKLQTLWRDTDDFLKKKDKCTLKELYQFWASAPYGIKKGLHSVLFLTYVFCRKNNIVAYLQGMYLPEITDLFVDYLIKESGDIEIKYIEISSGRQNYIKQLYVSLVQNFEFFSDCQENILDISRKLVAFIQKQNPWVLRTKSLSREAMRFRDLLKTASDPNKLIFEDLINIFNLPIDNLNKEGVQPVIAALQEIEKAYPNLIHDLGNILYSALQMNPLAVDLEVLHRRAKAVNHTSGDFRINALAAHLESLNIENDKGIAGIAGLAANKPIHDWIDLDVDRARIEIGALCDGFKKAELYTHFKGKHSNRHSFVILSSLNGTDIQQDLDFSLPEGSEEAITDIKQKLKQHMGAGNNLDVFRAALIELSLELIEDK